jgi:hypothetical protein
MAREDVLLLFKRTRDATADDAGAEERDSDGAVFRHERSR